MSNLYHDYLFLKFYRECLSDVEDDVHVNALLIIMNKRTNVCAFISDKRTIDYYYVLVCAYIYVLGINS